MNLFSPYVIQDSQKILVIVLENEFNYAIQLQHRTIVKGIPSFRLNSYPDMMMFVNGFLFGEQAGQQYDFYCEVMCAVFKEPLILQIFNVKVKRPATPMISSSKQTFLPGDGNG